VPCSGEFSYFANQTPNGIDGAPGVRRDCSALMSRTVRKNILGVEVEAHPIVFPVSAILIVVFVLLVAAYPAYSYMTFNSIQEWILKEFSWLYVLAMTGFLVFALVLGLGKFGHVRLGPDDSRPEFSTLSWFSMLFSAGMGIGMLFWGVAEPVKHYLSPPGAEGQTLQAARDAMGLTLFHWCLHPWALYALVALSLAYFGFRRGLPLSFRSVFFPFLGKRVHGLAGDVIDVFAVLATLFGLATSLGLGAKQVNAGLFYVFGLPQGPVVQVIIIFGITCCAVVSLVSGLEVGIRRLSELNMGLAGFLLVFLFIFGPTLFLMDSLIANVGQYISKIPRHSFWTGAYDRPGDAQWLTWWTVFYWGWWIAWSPFVGMFIARISKGRTIRQFIAGTLLVPTGVAIVWMTGIGGTALHQGIYDQILPEAKAAKLASAAYAPKTLPVMVSDEQFGLPLTPQDQLLAPDNPALASPDYVIVEPTGKSRPVDGAVLGPELFVTENGKEVFYSPKHGILLDAASGTPFHPDSSERYTGAFKAEEQEVNLVNYLSQPILNATHDTPVDTTSTALFFMLEAYPLASLTALIATISIILFFITSSDSASLVADIISSGGSEDPVVSTRIFWGVLEGCLAAVLLLAGGLQALQTGSITIALPFTFVIIGMCVCLYLGLSREARGEIPAEQLAHARAEN